MPNYKLYYFNNRGSAEPIRLIFAQAGVQYEDVRLTPEQWAEFKPKTPFGHVPVLEIDGKQFGGSLPITHYLAKQFGLVGDSDTAQLILEGVEDAIKDLRSKMGSVFLEKDEEKKAESRKKFAENVLSCFGALEKLAGANNCADGWFYGSKVTYAELSFVSMLEYIEMLTPDVLDKFPALMKLAANVRKLPNIAKWISERPQTDF